MKLQNPEVKRPKSLLNINTSYIDVTLEEKIGKMFRENEPISDTAPVIYTDRAKGVEAGYNVRTDRFDVAIEAMEKVTKDRLATRTEYLEKRNRGVGETPSHGSDGGDKAA